MSKDRRLGRGLAALLGTPTDETPAPAASSPPEAAPAPAPTLPRVAPETIADDDPPSREELLLDVYEIDDNPFQPRREFSETEIASLSESLKEHDMLQPVLVRRVNDRYQLISGERRLRAAIQAGWSKVPARLREADDRLVAELAIVENLQRQDLNPIEKALSFRRYLDEHGAKQDELAKRLKIDRSTIANLMRLLELPDQVQQLLSAGKVTAGHARALLPLGEESLQIDFCESIIASGWSVRETERQVHERVAEEDADPLTGSSSSSNNRANNKSHQITSLETTLRHALGTKVEIRQTARGNGRIILHFKNNAEYERLHDYLTDDGADDARRAA